MDKVKKIDLCTSYREIWNYQHKNFYGICLATKECDRCFCNGEKSKCTYYEHVKTSVQTLNKE